MWCVGRVEVGGWVGIMGFFGVMECEQFCNKIDHGDYVKNA